MSVSLFGDRHRPERRRRIYLFVVTAASVFLLTLVVGRRSSPPATVRAVIVHEGGANFDPLANDEITDEGNLRRALDEIAGSNENATGDDATPARDAVQRLQSSLHVKLRDGETSADGELEISYTGHNAGGAKLVNTLATLYVDAQARREKDAAWQNYQRAQQTADLAHGTMVAARQALDTFFAEHIAPLTATDQAATDRPPPSPAPEQAAPESAWHTIERQLAALHARRADLLAERTPLHPVVQEIEAEIKRTEETLAQTPRPPRQEVVVDLKPSESREAIDPLARSRALATFEQLRLEHATARAAYGRQYEVAQSAAARLPAAADVKMRVRSWAVPVPPRVAPSGSVALWALVLALVCGGAIAVWGVPADPRFHATEEVETELRLPVVGVIPAAAGASRPQPVALPNGTRYVKWGSEAVLAIFLFSVTLLVFVEAGFPARLVRDPLATLSGTLHGAGQVLGQSVRGAAG